MVGNFDPYHNGLVSTAVTVRQAENLQVEAPRSVVDAASGFE